MEQKNFLVVYYSLTGTTKSPVWAMNIPPAIRTFVKNYCHKFNSVSFFCTMRWFGDKRFFSKLEFLCNKKPVICASFKRMDIISGKLKNISKIFV